MKFYVYDFAEFLISNVSLKEDSVDSFELQGVSCEEIVVRNFFEFRATQCGDIFNFYCNALDLANGSIVELEKINELHKSLIFYGIKKLSDRNIETLKNIILRKVED